MRQLPGIQRNRSDVVLLLRANVKQQQQMESSAGLRTDLTLDSCECHDGRLQEASEGWEK